MAEAHQAEGERETIRAAMRVIVDDPIVSLLHELMSCAREGIPPSEELRYRMRAQFGEAGAGYISNMAKLAAKAEILSVRQEEVLWFGMSVLQIERDTNCSRPDAMMQAAEEIGLTGRDGEPLRDQNSLRTRMTEFGRLCRQRGFVPYLRQNPGTENLEFTAYTPSEISRVKDRGRPRKKIK